MPQEFKNTKEALSVLEKSQRIEDRALAFVLKETLLYEYDLEWVAEPEPPKKKGWFAWLEL